MASSTRRAAGWSAPAPPTPAAPSPGSTPARCTTTGGSTTRRSARCARRSRATPTTPKRTTCSRSCTATSASTRRRGSATKRAIALNPTLAKAQANLALERFSEGGRREEAAAAAAAAPESGAVSRRSIGPQSVPGAALAHFNLGLALRQKGYHQEALREYHLALEAGEDRRLNLQAMAEVHLLRRELGAALELYEGLIREYPDSPKLWNERGVCLHQAGRRAEAIVSYERAVAIDSAYQLAWNNLGVVRAHEKNPEAAMAAFRQALGADRPLLAARLNLGLLAFQRRQFRTALEEYQQALAEQPASAVAWNGVGLVLMELRRYEDARNAFGRAVDADAGFAAAHYNLSFVLSQLGDFDGALRETRRALELEPLYVPQKFSLTIDLQFEDPTIAIAPELAAEAGGDELAGEFEFDAPALDRIFEELTPGPQPTPVAAAPGDALDLARDYIGKGLLDLALAEISRAVARGAPKAAAAVLLGDVFAKRGLYGEALERYRQARIADPDDPDATLGEIRALLALGWAADAAPLADDLARTGARRRRGAGRAGACAARGGRRAGSTGLHPGGAVGRARTPRPAASAGPGVLPARRPLGRARGVQRGAAARSLPGAGLVRTRARWRRSGRTGAPRAPPTSARSTCCRPTALRRSRSRTCSTGVNRLGRRSGC